MPCVVRFADADELRKATRNYERFCDEFENNNPFGVYAVAAVWNESNKMEKTQRRNAIGKQTQKGDYFWVSWQINERWSCRIRRQRIVGECLG